LKKSTKIIEKNLHFYEFIKTISALPWLDLPCFPVTDFCFFMVDFCKKAATIGSGLDD